MTVDEARRLDARLALLGRGLGVMRLRLGEGLIRLEAAGGWRSLGFPTLESYCREALGRSGRWGSDIRALARRLAVLPRLRGELIAGRLSSSMVELVSRVATAATEGAWIARALGRTVRAMREMLEVAPDPDDEPPSRTTITATVDRIDAWAFEQARMMVESVGAARGDLAIEAMLAEGLTEILVRHPKLELPDGIALSDAALAWRAALARLREAREIACEPLVDAAVEPYEPEPEIAWPDRADAIDQTLREAARELAWRDVELAHLGRRCFEHEVWLRCGYASFQQYCRERLGVSASSVANKVGFSRRISKLPEIEEAVGEGRVGYESAFLVARVAGPTTVSAWLARAEHRTVKHLREEVEAIETIARAEGQEPTRLMPPDDATRESFEALERNVIGLVTGAEPSYGPDATEATAETALIQMSGGAKTMLRLTVSDDIARFWRALETVHTGLDLPGSFVEFLVRSVMKSWAGAVSAKLEYADVYVRDRWRCATPVCRNRNVTPHHLKFRSRGGGEERTNILSLCETCHLELVHGGLLTVNGEAGGELVWRATGWSVENRLLTTGLEAPRAREPARPSCA